jgi:hypothetical protein
MTKSANASVNNDSSEDDEGTTVVDTPLVANLSSRSSPSIKKEDA